MTYAALTPRQRQLCDLLVAGHTVTTAAPVLGITLLTARSLARDARRAYAAKSLQELVDLHSDGTAVYQYKHGGGKPRTDKLSPAEYALFELAATGLTWTEICVLNKVTYNTVRTQTARAYRKLGVNGKLAALAKLGLLKTPQPVEVVELSEPFAAEVAE